MDLPGRRSSIKHARTRWPLAWLALQRGARSLLHQALTCPADGRHASARGTRRCSRPRAPGFSPQSFFPAAPPNGFRTFSAAAGNVGMAVEGDCSQVLPSAELARGISPRAAHRSVREPLDSYGSCHSPKTAVFRRDLRAPPVSRWPMDPSASDPPPSLHPHYRDFITTTGQSAPVRRIGTFSLVVLPLAPFPLASTTRFSSSVH